MAAPSALGGTFISEYRRYVDIKLEANKYTIYGIFAIIIASIIYFILTFKPPDPFKKGETIRWVVTGDVGTSESGAKYSYNGVDYIDTEGEYLLDTKASGYGKAYDNDNFFWIVGGGIPQTTGENFSSLLNSYNGYMWIINKNQLSAVYDVEYGLSGMSEPLWMATGVNVRDTGAPTFFSNNVIHSKDGQNWTRSTGISFEEGFALSYGKTLGGEHMYQAGGYIPLGRPRPAGGYILHSYEGMCWINSTGYKFYGPAGKPLAIEYGVSSDKTTKIWVATGVQATTKRSLIYSLNGISWYPSTGEDFEITGSYRSGDDVAFGLDIYGDPLWVAVGNSFSSSILYSHDGQYWHKSSGICFKRGVSVAYGKDSNDDSVWVATGIDPGADHTNEILISYNGISWESTNDPAFSLSMGYSVASNVLKYGVESF